MGGVEPRMIEMEPGGWLAVSEADAPVPLGVFGATEQEARERFQTAVQIREEMHASAPA